MSGDVTIDCPHCGKGIALTEALAGPLLEKERTRARAEASTLVESERASIVASVRADLAEKHAAELRARDELLYTQKAKVQAAETAELAARKAKQETEEARALMELDVQRRVDEASSAIAAQATKSATAAGEAKLRAVEAQLVEQAAKMKEAQKAELEARRLRAEAEAEKQEVELTVARRMDEERAVVREKTLRERDEEHRLKLGERDQRIAQMSAQIEELRRTGSNTSQQLVGDVSELDLLTILQSTFIQDRFERIKKGQRGADVLQTVIGSGGTICGTIVWESKRTKAWQPAWLGKLREDQREMKADVAALATEALPDTVQTFEQIDGVWVTGLSTIKPVAAAIRHSLIEVSAARRAGTLDDSKKEKVFSYLTSPTFRQRVTGIAEGYSDLRTDLDREKRTMQTAWNKREKTLDRVLGGITGMYGDLQGIVGSGLPPVEGLSLPAPEPVAVPQLTVVGSYVKAADNTDLI